MKAAKDSTRDVLGECAAGTVDLTSARASNGNTVVTTTEIHVAARRSRKPAIVLAAVQGNARFAPASRPPWTAAARDGRRELGRDGGMVLRLDRTEEWQI